MQPYQRSCSPSSFMMQSVCNTHSSNPTRQVRTKRENHLCCIWQYSCPWCVSVEVSRSVWDCQLQVPILLDLLRAWIPIQLRIEVNKQKDILDISKNHKILGFNVAITIFPAHSAKPLQLSHLPLLNAAITITTKRNRINRQKETSGGRWDCSRQGLNLRPSHHWIFRLKY